jgi:hypothetical protein
METAHVSQPQSGSMENVREVSRKLSSRFEELSPGLFLTGAAASIALSFVLRITGRQHDAQFVGQWAPTLLLFGLYTREGRGLNVASKRYESGQEAASQGMH